MYIILLYKYTKKMGRGGEEEEGSLQALISFVVGVHCLLFGTVGYFVWGVDYHQPEISWQSATCQLHASHLSIMYDSEMGSETTEGKKFQEVMVSHDVDVFAANSQSFRVCVHAASGIVRRANVKMLFTVRTHDQRKER